MATDLANERASIPTNQMAPKMILVKKKNVGETSKKDEYKTLSPMSSAIIALVTLVRH